MQHQEKRKKKKKKKDVRSNRVCDHDGIVTVVIALDL